jgi:hypothetical protein
MCAVHVTCTSWLVHHEMHVLMQMCATVFIFLFCISIALQNLNTLYLHVSHMPCTYNVAFVMLVVLNNTKVPTATTMRTLKRKSVPKSTVSKRMKGAPAVNDEHVCTRNADFGSTKHFQTTACTIVPLLHTECCTHLHMYIFMCTCALLKIHVHVHCYAR